MMGRLITLLTVPKQEVRRTSSRTVNGDGGTWVELTKIKQQESLWRGLVCAGLTSIKPPNKCCEKNVGGRSGGHTASKIILLCIFCSDTWIKAA